MLEKIKSYIEKNQMIKKGDTIILGISGGADSVCLFFVLLELQKLYDLHLVGVHVNHNLRGEDARKDQAYVEEICKLHGVECVVVSVDVEAEAGKRKKSIEETGREVRKEAFAQVAESVEDGQGVKIATAHHGNDNAETFLMNLVRGSGITGLKGMAPVRDNYIRPLLVVQRNEVEKYLEENKKNYCIDMTNHENIYIRNRIRNKVVPALEEVNEQAVSHIETVMEELARVEAYLQEQVDEIWNTCVNMDEGGAFIEKEALAMQPLMIQEKLIKRVLEQVAQCQKDITRTHVEQLLELGSKQVGREIHLPYGMVAIRVYDGVNLQSSRGTGGNQWNPESLSELDVRMRLIDCEDAPGNPENQMEHLQDTPYTKYFDYDIIKKMPSVRAREMGDQLTINATGNKQSLKKYFITNKVSSNLRDIIPLLAVDNEILWIMGYRKSSGYEITEKTKKILEVQYNGGYHGRNN